MILQFSSEFKRIAESIGAEYVSKKVSEIEDFVQNHDFEKPVVNFRPIETFNSSKGINGLFIYEGQCVIEFIQKIVKSNNYEAKKDETIDEMIDLSEQFFSSLHANENLIFQNPEWSIRNDIDRLYTSNYLIAVRSNITFSTSCKRIG